MAACCWTQVPMPWTPPCIHATVTFMTYLSFLSSKEAEKHAYVIWQLYIRTQNPPARALVHVSLWQHGKSRIESRNGDASFSFLLRSDLYVVSLHRAITERLPCSTVWQASRSGRADANAAIVSCRATSCRLPGPCASDALTIWHTWSEAPLVSRREFCFSRAPTHAGIDLVELHSHLSADKCRCEARRCAESAWIFHQHLWVVGWSLKWSVSSLSVASL